jgi:hypothetical protein
VHHALRHALAIEVLHLLDDVMVVEDVGPAVSEYSSLAAGTPESFVVAEDAWRRRSNRCSS